MEQSAGRPSRAEMICCLSKVVGFDQQATGFAKESNAKVPLALPDLPRSRRFTGWDGSHFLLKNHTEIKMRISPFGFLSQSFSSLRSIPFYISSFLPDFTSTLEKKRERRWPEAGRERRIAWKIGD